VTKWRTPEEVLSTCYFCGESFTPRRGTRPEDQDWVEEIGEWWSEKLQHSVLAHPDCLPMGVTATLNGEDEEWSMA
jgi:hypothetical protein